MIKATVNEDTKTVEEILHDIHSSESQIIDLDLNLRIVYHVF